MWLQNTGLLDRFFIDVLNPPREIPLKRIRINEPLNMQQLATAAIVMWSGIVICSFIFLGELCCGSPEKMEIMDKEEEKNSGVTLRPLKSAPMGWGD